MTYDERQEIEEWLTIIDKNSKRLERSIEMLKKKMDEYKCETTKNKTNSNT